MESERCWYHHFRATQQTSLDLYLPPPQRFPPPLFPLAPFPQSTPGFLSLTVHVFLSFFLSEAYSTTIPSSVSVLLPSFLPLVAFPWSPLRPGAVIASFASVGFVFTRLVPCAQGRGGCRPVGWGAVGGTRGGAGPSFPAVVARALPFWDSRLCLLHTCWETSSCLLICFAVSVEEQGKRDCGPRSSGSGSEGSRSHRCSPWCRTSADLSGYIPSCPAIPLSPVHPQ